MPHTLDHVEQKHRKPQGVILTLSIAAMLGMVNMASIGAFMPAIGRDLGVSIPVLGQVATVTFIGAACVSIFAGPIADIYGKRRLLMLGLAAATLSALGTSLAPTYGWLLGARLISAISGGVLAGTTLAMAGTLFDGDERRRAMSWIASGIASGAIVGIPFLTLVATVTSWRGAFALVSGLALLWIILIRRLLPDDAVRGGRIQAGSILSAYRPLLRERAMLSLYGSTIARAIGWVGTLTYIGAFLADELNLTTSEIGWAYMAGGSGYFIGTKLGGSRLGGRDLRATYGVGTALMAILLGAAISVPAGAVFAIGLIALAAIAGGFGWVALVTLVSTSSPAGQGTTMSLNAAMFQVGSALGGFFGGVLIAAGGYASLGLGLMGFGILAASLIWRPTPLAVLSRTLRPAAAD